MSGFKFLRLSPHKALKSHGRLWSQQKTQPATVFEGSFGPRTVLERFSKGAWTGLERVLKGFSHGLAGCARPARPPPALCQHCMPACRLLAES